MIDNRLNSAAADEPVKFESDRTTLKPYLWDSRDLVIKISPLSEKTTWGINHL